MPAQGEKRGNREAVAVHPADETLAAFEALLEARRALEAISLATYALARKEIETRAKYETATSSVEEDLFKGIVK